ncbi:SDR family oxidoreductase [Cellulomonas phragmiteti]|uniref:2,3-dihydro-2,3-dihydroxybenzoate dehydrogenase n=1 Tax=Cellulomonas phragmiteti TaxID=478780 RepID=A0ABQ4DNM2_9CELL|nr:SDR family oxidoreductase [Cellulomonas phragmiteti]GIG40582.1 2,3-dihydro-2,3-dihydroxybenzoate dehydrogenase [Cellulomonas phragmiteti]
MTARRYGTRPVALVTGAARGIGLAVARLLAGRGDHVACLDVDARALHAAVAEGVRDGLALSAHPADVTDAGAVQDAVRTVEDEHGPVVRLAHCAGVVHVGDLLQADGHDLARLLDVNVGGVLHVVGAVGARMAARGTGAVVVVSSNAAATPRRGIGAYAASKAAATMLARCLALELAPHGVRCNVVSPGSTDTAMLRATLGTDLDEDALRRAHERTVAGSAPDFRLGIPLGRIATADDVADAVAFLLSDDARHITLHDLRVDGGATLGASA